MQPLLDNTDRIHAELGAVASGFSEELNVEGDPELAAVVEALRDRRLAEEYAMYVPLAFRFVEAELDADAPSMRGIGRLADGDPPPRLGAKYRSVLQNDQASAAFVRAAEQAVLGGYAARGALYDEETVRDLGTDVVWSRLLRRVSASYNAMNEMMRRARKEERTLEGYASMLTVLITTRGADALIEAMEQFGIVKPRGLTRRFRTRPLTYVSLFLGVGHAMRASVEANADDNFGASFSVEELEDYVEPRKLRELT